MGWTRPLLTMMGLTIGLVGCQSFNVRTDWDPAADFDVFQRYLWVEPPKVEGVSPFADNTLLRKRVRFVLEFELKQAGYEPYLVVDAVSSRKPEDKAAAVVRLRNAGVAAVTTEMVLFEWLARGDTAEFRDLLGLIKDDHL